MTFPARISALAATAALAFAAACGGSDSGTGPTNTNTLLDVTNNSSVSVWLVYVRNCGSQSWGNDLLGADIISPGLGQSFVVTPGCHDVKLMTNPDVNGELVWMNVNFPAGQVVERVVTSWNPVQ
jgi:hypothetical protein